MKTAPRFLACIPLAAVLACSSTAPETEVAAGARESVELRATLGASTSVPSSEVTQQMDLTHKVRVHGRVIDEVEPGSAAAEAGLQPGDVLLRLGENDLYSADDIADFLSVSSQSDQVLVSFKSAGEVEPREATVTLGGERIAAEGPRLRWQFASLGQLPEALDIARAKKKKIMVGLSGSET